MNRALLRLLNKYVDINKLVVEQQALAVVPAKRRAKQPINDLDIEEDYIFFCFTKFTKTLISIQTLLKQGLYEDALILSRSNYECLIHAKSVIKNNTMIDHLVEYKLGLINEKRYKYVENKKGYKIRNRIIDVKDDSDIMGYVSSVKEIAQKADEEISYEYVYSYLCEITHCNIITSAYYRDGVHYSYELENDIALKNVLLWNVCFTIKFYNVLIDAEIFEISELEDMVLDVLISDQLKIHKFFEDEEKRIARSIDKDIGEEEKKRLEDYLKVVSQIKKNLV